MGKYPSCDSCDAYVDKFCVDRKSGVRKFEPDPRLCVGCPDHQPVKLFRMHDHENRKSIWPNILDNNGIELDEKNPGPVGGSQPSHDPVKKPKHYTQGEIEVIDFVLDQKFDYCEGNVVKYLCRYKYKGKPLEDLMKARTYLDRLIEREIAKVKP